MRYYELTDRYKRDINFVFNEELNDLDYFELSNGQSIVYNKPVFYTVDKIDTYIDKYDLLPTLGPLLVSSRFKNIFSYLENTEMQFFNAIITDKSGNNIKDFYTLNITNTINCLDLDKSIIEMTKYGTRNMKKKFFRTNALADFSIVRMKEHKSYVVVTEEFKNRCQAARLKGIEFLEEGYSIYKDI